MPSAGYKRVLKIVYLEVRISEAWGYSSRLSIRLLGHSSGLRGDSSGLLGYFSELQGYSCALTGYRA